MRVDRLRLRQRDRVFRALASGRISGRGSLATALGAFAESTADGNVEERAAFGPVSAAGFAEVARLVEVVVVEVAELGVRRAAARTGNILFLWFLHRLRERESETERDTEYTHRERDREEERKTKRHRIYPERAERETQDTPTGRERGRKGERDRAREGEVGFVAIALGDYIENQEGEIHEEDQLYIR